MTRDCILAIDQGTTGSTCLLVDRELRVLGRATHEFPQHFPRPGWVEHDPEQLWQSVRAAVAEVLAQPEAEAKRIAAIGITNQRETSLIWERATGVPIHRAIVWQDRRTADTCTKLRSQGHEARVRDLTGLVLDPYFSATKVQWILDAVPGARTRAEHGELLAGTVDSYLLWRLTGGEVHATEATNACRTSLWPLEGHEWSAELCALFGVPIQLLPKVLSCTAPFGLTKGLAELPDGIPIHGMAGDQQAALFGQACFEPGEAKCTYGTGAFMVLNTGPSPVRSNHGLLTSVAWTLGNEVTYCLEGSAFMAGAVVQWLRDQLGIIESAPDIEPLAASVPDSGGVTLVPGHAGLGAPHWRPEARGIIRGLTRGSTRAHIARAALEGIALQIVDLAEAMALDLGGRLQILKVDGGAAANDLLMQIQADLLGLPLARPASLEATGLGAVSLAGLGVGLWKDLATLRKIWREDRRFDPSEGTDVRALRHRWREAVECA